MARGDSCVIQSEQKGVNEIAETLRRYLDGERGKAANNKELRSAVLGWLRTRTARGPEEQRRRGRTRIMRGEDDMESSGGRDRETRSSRHAGERESGRGRRRSVNVAEVRCERRVAEVLARAEEGQTVDRVRGVRRWGRGHAEGGCEVTSRRVDTHTTPPRAATR